MKDKKGGELICKRPETIVEARFKLSKKQNDILDMVFATIENDDKLEYEIEISKYAKLYLLKNQSNVYADLKKATKSFEGKGFKILNKEKKREDYFPWFSRITYLDGESKIVVELGKTLKQLFLDVKRACFYNIKYSLNFKSIYSQRLYYYLKTFEDTGFRVDNLEELKMKLVCPSSYKNFSDFKRFVMVPAYEDINGDSDMNFEYEPQYTGKKVTSLKFYIKTNKSKILSKPELLPNVNDEVSATVTDLEEETPIKKIMALMSDYKVTALEAKKIYDSSENNIDIIYKVYRDKKDKPSNGIVGLMISLVKPGVCIEPKKSYKKDSFNDYPQRNYDFPNLEKKLLGWDKITTDEATNEEESQQLLMSIRQ